MLILLFHNCVVWSKTQFSFRAINPSLYKDSFWHINKTAFEKIVGKEEIARIDQFLLFAQGFLLNQVIVPAFIHIFDASYFYLLLNWTSQKIGIWGKGLK